MKEVYRSPYAVNEESCIRSIGRHRSVATELQLSYDRLRRVMVQVVMKGFRLVMSASNTHTRRSYHNESHRLSHNAWQSQAHNSKYKKKAEYNAKKIFVLKDKNPP